VADARMAALVAGVFAGRGVDALVFRGDDGLDELTTATTSRMWVVHDGAVSEVSLDPAELGFAYSPADALRGGDVAFNTDVTRRLLAGEQGPVRDAVLLNTAAALVAYEGTGGAVVDRMREAASRAAQSIDSGAAAEVLARWVRAAAA
jgi:anthranilate phosphoribosyltransferase